LDDIALVHGGGHSPFVGCSDFILARAPARPRDGTGPVGGWTASTRMDREVPMAKKARKKRARKKKKANHGRRPNA
jgi:hypothetical protein